MVQRDDVAPQWSGLYVSMNKDGAIVMNRTTYSRLREPAAFHVLFDRVNSRIALKPTARSLKHAYPAQVIGRRGAKVVRVNRLIKEFGIMLPDTVEFPDAEIDHDGQLILDLRTAKVSRKAHSQCRKNSESRIG